MPHLGSLSSYDFVPGKFLGGAHVLMGVPGAVSKPLNTTRVSLGEKGPFVAVVLFWVL